MKEDTFEVGEIATVRSEGRYNSTECAIIGPFALYTAKRREGGRVHIVRTAGYDATLCDGVRVVIEPKNLRKKKPPQQDTATGSWDECPFKPASMRTENCA